MSKQKKIGVLMGGRSEEREISLRSGRAILKALQERGYNALAIEVDENLAHKLIEEGIERAFLALHGRGGEDGTVQGMLEIMKIPYTGSGVLASALAMDKLMTKRLLCFHKLPTPRFEVLKDEGIEDIKIDFPLVIKPRRSGSTVGVSVVKEKGGLLDALKEARRFDSEVLAEEFIPGMEITVGILGGRALPIIEIVPQGGLYDYQSKYTPGRTQYILPARISKANYIRAQEIAIQAYHALDCQGQARVDLMVEEEPYILEINTIPGMTEGSLLPKAAQAIGMSFEDLVEEILSEVSLKMK